MSIFRRSEKPQRTASAPHQALKRIYLEEGIPLDIIEKHLEQVPLFRIYLCPSGCAPMLLIGERTPPPCPYCGKAMNEAPIGEDYSVPSEYHAEIKAYALILYAKDRAMKGDMEKAEALLIRALSLKPGLEDAYHNRSEARFALGNLKGALDDCNEVISLNPQAADAYLTRSAAKAMLGDFAGGAEDADTALKLGIQLPVAYFNRGVCRLYTGNREGGRTDLEHFLKLAPDDERSASAQQILRMEKEAR